MKDLSVLVVEQGELLDKIDYNINKASDSVQARAALVILYGLSLGLSTIL